MAESYNAGIVTAYGAAVRGGYTGTYDEFCNMMANSANNAAEADAAADRAEAVLESIPSDYSTLSNDVTSLKADITSYTGCALQSGWVSGYYIKNNSGTVDINSPVSTSTYSYLVLSCSAGDAFTITGKGSSSARLYAFIDSSGTILENADSGATLTLVTLEAPTNSAYLVANVDNTKDYALYKGIFPVKLDDFFKIKALPKLGNVKLDDDSIVYDLLDNLNWYDGKTLSNANFKQSDVLNAISLLTSSASAKFSEVIRIRDINGTMLGNFHCTYGSNIQSAVICFGYQKDGSHDRKYNATDVVNGILTFDASTYYIAFLKYSTIELSVWCSVGKVVKHYSVGTGKDYTYFSDCLKALAGDTSEKIIDIYGGTYDILTEIGGTTYINSCSASDNWYDVCDIVPPNTHIIGHGNVVLDLTIPNSVSADLAVHFSPLNIRGSATVENVTIKGDGCRYCIHAEGSKEAQFDNAVWRIINCRVEKDNNLSGTPNAIGVGINDGNLLEITDCIIKNNGNTGLLIHDNQDSSGDISVSPTVLVADSAISVDYYPIVLSSTHRSVVTGNIINVSVINCFVNNKFMRKIASASDTPDNFAVTYINTPHRVQNGSGLTNIIADVDYNNYSL